jgi:hypothetical protein
MTYNTDYAVLITIAAIIGGFGILALLVRIGIELSVWDRESVTWVVFRRPDSVGAGEFKIYGYVEHTHRQQPSGCRMCRRVRADGRLYSGYSRTLRTHPRSRFVSQTRGTSLIII